MHAWKGSIETRAIQLQPTTSPLDANKSDTLVLKSMFKLMIQTFFPLTFVNTIIEFFNSPIYTFMDDWKPCKEDDGPCVSGFCLSKLGTPCEGKCSVNIFCSVCIPRLICLHTGDLLPSYSFKADFLLPNDSVLNIVQLSIQTITHSSIRNGGIKFADILIRYFY